MILALRAPLAGLALLASATAVAAQPAFDPFPGTTAQQYRFDLERVFFPSPAAEQVERAALLARAARLASGHPDPGGSAPALERLLLAADSIRRLAGKHLAYLSLRANVDTRDVAAATAVNALSDSLGRALAFLGPALAAIPEDALRRYASERPGIAPFLFFIRESRRGARASAAADAVAAEMTGWQPALFWSLIGEIQWGTVQAPEGVLDVRRQGNQIANHPERAVREAWFRANQRGRAQHRGSFALLLGGNVDSRNALAKLRGFQDYPEEFYGGLYLRTDDVRQLLQALASRGETNRRYERARVAHLRQTAGIDTVHAWDLTLPEPGMEVPRFTVPEASRVIQQSLAVLGPAYARHLADLLDPRNGRLDMVARENRVTRPGFSTGSVGFPSMFFQGRYEGYLPDVVIFAHEIGHGVQNSLMDAHGVAAANAGGPAYFTESFAGFTELLVTDWLYRTAPDRARKIYYLQAFLDRAAEVFDNARASAFEQALYDSAAAGGGIRTADAAERLMQGLGGEYSIWYGDRGEWTDQWAQTIHYYTRPLYRINYVYSKLLALKYFELYQRDPAAFVPRYAALLSNGYDAEPNALLRRFLGFDLATGSLVNDAARVIEARTAELERLYEETPAR
jgi:oligoendopeptidase F